MKDRGLWGVSRAEALKSGYETTKKDTEGAKEKALLDRWQKNERALKANGGGTNEYALALGVRKALKERFAAMGIFFGRFTLDTAPPPPEELAASDPDGRLEFLAKHGV